MIGNKIKELRLKRGLTQKELGLAVGFNKVGADVRIAQYESNSRAPKEDVVKKIAEVLKVNPDYLLAPFPLDAKQFFHILLSMDLKNNARFHIEDYVNMNGDADKEASVHIPSLDIALKHWSHVKKAFERGEITEDEYYEWKVNWPDSALKWMEEGATNE